MIIPDLSHREIGHSNIQFISLLVMHLGISILGTSRRWVPVRVPLGTVPYILTRFTTVVTVYRDCNLLRISTSNTPSDPTTDAFWWRCSSLGGSGQGSRKSSGYILKYHGLKRHRPSREGSLISSRETQFSSQCSRLMDRVPVVGTNKLLVLGFSRPNDVLKVQTILKIHVSITVLAWFVWQCSVEMRC